MGQIDTSPAPEEWAMQAIHLDYRKRKASAVRKAQARSEFRSWEVQRPCLQGEEQAAE